MWVDSNQLIPRIHDSGTQIVLAMAGGASRAAAQLLEVPGASRTVLGVVVPYSEAAMRHFLGGEVDRLCSDTVARAMAMTAYLRACRYGVAEVPKAGLACTASLATDRPKRGAHRAHLAIQTESLTATRSVELAKGRSRKEEEALVTGLMLNLVAEACGLADRLQLGLLPEETIREAGTVASQAWRDLLAGRLSLVCHGRTAEKRDPSGPAIFPGAFNPLHDGHRRMAQLAAEILDSRVEFEMSMLNVDKPPLDFREMDTRLSQFRADQTVWLTRAPTFVEKSAQFPGATFLVGADTLVRIADPRYYAASRSACLSAMEQIAAAGCRFLVFGRDCGGRFLTLRDVELPGRFAAICRQVPADRFRQDVSSTDLRRSFQDGHHSGG